MVEGAVAIVSFCAGLVFADVWPRFVKWMDRPKRTVSTTYLTTGWMAPGERELPAKPQPHRRTGLAEKRIQAEFESLKPIEHRDKVTENNIKAMEGK